MVDFISTFRLISKRFFSAWNTTLWICLFLIITVSNFKGINSYKGNVAKEKEFKKIQDQYFQKTPNYEGYGRDGIKSLFIPSPNSALFRNTILPPDLVSEIDSIVELSLSNNLKGKSLSPANLSYKLDFSGIVLLVFVFLALFYGYELIAYQVKRYMHFLSKIRTNKLMLEFMFSKFVIFIISFSFLCATQVGIALINGVHFNSIEFLNLSQYLVAAFVIFLFFYLIGVIVGSLKIMTLQKFSLLFPIWFLFIFAVPAIISNIVESRLPDVIEDYTTELEKFNVVIDFEERAKIAVGKFDRKKIEPFQELAEGYWAKDYKKIEALETSLQEQIAGGYYLFKNIAALSPTSFYLLVTNELSSRGYVSFLDFYNFTSDLKRKFLRFYIDRTMYNDPKEMVNFLKSNNNIYYAQSRIPSNFWTGVAINTFWCLILAVFAFYRFRAYIYPTAKNPETYKNVSIDIVSGKHTGIRTDTLKPQFVTHFMSYLAGRQRNFNGAITLDGKRIPNNLKPRISILPNPEQFFCDLKVKTLLDFIKKLHHIPPSETANLTEGIEPYLMDECFDDLEHTEKARVLFNIARTRHSDFYVLDYFAASVKSFGNELKSFFTDVKQRGATIIDFHTSEDSLWVAPEGYYSYIFSRREKTYVELLNQPVVNKNN